MYASMALRSLSCACTSSLCSLRLCSRKPRTFLPNCSSLPCAASPSAWLCSTPVRPCICTICRSSFCPSGPLLASRPWYFAMNAFDSLRMPSKVCAYCAFVILPLLNCSWLFCFRALR